MSVFASPELKDEAAFVVAVEESLGAAHFDIVVVLARAYAEFHFLHPCGALGLLFFEFGLFVFELSVVHDFADGWVHLTGDFDEVESEGLCFGECFAGTHDAELLAVVGDDAYARGADSVVNPRHVAVTTPILVSTWFSDGFVLRWVCATRQGAASRS